MLYSVPEIQSILCNSPPQLLFVHSATTALGEALGPTLVIFRRLSLENGDLYPGPAGNKGNSKCGQLEKTTKAGELSHLQEKSLWMRRRGDAEPCQSCRGRTLDREQGREGEQARRSGSD